MTLLNDIAHTIKMEWMIMNREANVSHWPNRQFLVQSFSFPLKNDFELIVNEQNILNDCHVTIDEVKCEDVECFVVCHHVEQNSDLAKDRWTMPSLVVDIFWANLLRISSHSHVWGRRRNHVRLDELLEISKSGKGSWSCLPLRNKEEDNDNCPVSCCYSFWLRWWEEYSRVLTLNV